jgi:hypothetical protein
MKTFGACKSSGFSWLVLSAAALIDRPPLK